MEEKYRIKYKNLKTGKNFDIKCIEKVYQTIRKMEKKGEAIIDYDERSKRFESLLNKDLEIK